jgi:monofunctional biosynthetic peptidoglycan transglycosylase
LRQLLKRILQIVFALFLSSIFVVMLYRFLPVPFTPLMLWRSLEYSQDAKFKTHHDWVSRDQIAKYLRYALIRAEDARFYEHQGFDWEAIEKAMAYNQTHKKKKGASTISQQTAKNVFLWPSRSWIRKGLEAYFTVLIEFFWSKERIIEVYMNVIEFGKGVYGVQAASQVYFKKNANQLNRAECALLASVLPNPIKFRVDRPSSYVLRRQGRILARMNVNEQQLMNPSLAMKLPGNKKAIVTVVDDDLNDAHADEPLVADEVIGKLDDHVEQPQIEADEIPLSPDEQRQLEVEISKEVGP